MPQCMEKYKNKFAIEFAKVMQQNSAEWKASQDTHIKNLCIRKYLQNPLHIRPQICPLELLS